MLVAEGEIGRLKVVCAAQDFAFMAGSMGMYVGNAIVAAAERAVKLKAPLVLFAAAGGARMQEGILSLMQMPRTTVAVQMLKEAGLPYVVVLTHPTTGGVTASYAMLGDVQIAEPDALICFAGPRVIEQTIRETLPEGFQRAEYLLDHGMLDRVVAAQGPARRARVDPAAADAASRRRCSATCRRPPPAEAGRAGRARAMTRHDRASDRVLERLTSLHPKVIDLTLGRIERLLAALGHPERRLPPVIHVAGTNGKGSTVAMIRAGLEARGRAASMSTPRRISRASTSASGSPGELIDEDRADRRCSSAARRRTAARRSPSSRSPPPRPSSPSPRRRRTATLLEVGLGGRLDATNVIDRPRADGHHAGLDRPPAVSRRDAGRDRLREGRHPQARRPLRRRAAGARRPGT